jgi:hypothetical protein
MKNRLIITEDEKRRILGLHKSLMVEQPVSNPEEYDRRINYSCVLNHPNMSTQTPTGGETEYILGNLKFKLNGTYYVDDNPSNLLTYSCKNNTIVTQGHGSIKSTQNFLKPNYDCVKNHRYMSTQTRTGGETEYIWGNLKFKLNGTYYNEKDPNKLYGYFCNPNNIENIITDKHGDIKADSQPSKDTIVTDFDRAWDYKKTDNNDVYVKKKNTEKWYKVTDEDTKENILSVVFKVKLPCTFPKEACPSFDGGVWLDDKNTDKDMDLDKQLKFCSKNYCALKWIQASLNFFIREKDTTGHKKLKDEKQIEVDGKFGTDTQNLLYKLLGKNTASKNDIVKQY